MKIQLRPLAALSSVLMFSPLMFSQSAQAQTSIDLKSAEQSKVSQLSGQTTSIRYFSRGLGKKGWNQEIVHPPQSNPLIAAPSGNRYLKNDAPLFFNKGLGTLKEDPNAGSVDPGIFYAPAEPQKPAAIVLKPLKNLDPQMVIRPEDVSITPFHKR